MPTGNRAWAVLAVLFLAAAGWWSPGAVDAAEAPASARGESLHWAQYLRHHTAGTVSRDADIRLVFQHDVLPPGVDSSDLEGVFRIEPSVAGSVQRVSGSELVFRPAEGLDPGTEYSVRVDPARLGGLPDGLEPYAFRFAVITPELRVRIDPPSLGGDEGVRVAGRLSTSDRVKPATAREIVTARYRGRDVDLDWRHAESGRSHVFTASGLDRPDEPASLTFRWAGEAIGAETEGARDVPIPVRGTLQVADVRVEREPSRRVQITFTERLDPGQDASGLFALEGASFDTRVSGNTATLFVTDLASGQAQRRASLRVNPGLRSVSGERLDAAFETELVFDHEDPQVRFAGSGVILPAGEHLEIPIETMNVDSLQVQAMRIYEDNIGQFLQVNDLDERRELRRVGRNLWRRTIELPDNQRNQWQRYSLDVSELASSHPNALFRLELSINRGNATYPCGDSESRAPVWREGPPENYDGSDSVAEDSNWDYAEAYYGADSGGSSRADRRDPCRNAYYRHSDQVRDQRNFLASNIGLIAKRGNDGSFVVVSTDLRTGEPLPDTRIELRNYQDQPVDTLHTDAQGMARVQLESVPYYLVARHGGRQGYLKVDRGSALPTSHLDTGGQTVEQGVKGTIYGERGVWRPGDTMHLTFVLHDPDDAVPAGHPATLHLLGPRGQIRRTSTNRNPLDGFYRFSVATANDAPTGRWTARVLVGDKQYDRTVRVETVKPNRLDMNLEPGAEPLLLGEEPVPFDFRARWLHGATASQLEADVEVRYAPVDTTFNRFSGYEFDDPVRAFDGEPATIWEGRLDDEGRARFETPLRVPGQPAGTLRAAFTSRVFEPGGEFSVGTQSLTAHPYHRYVGVRMPEGDASRGMLLTDKTHEVAIGTLTHDGEPADVDAVEVRLYELDWKWWWDSSAESVTAFSSAEHRTPVDRATVSTTDGRGVYRFEIQRPAWGRYLLRACDSDGGHCTGEVFYIDWPGWAGQPQEQAEAASVLTFSADKDDYRVGETAVLTMPSGLRGRGLLTIEDGSGILSQRWLTFDGEGRRRVRVPIRQGMAPNVYAAVTVIQPHSGRDNDRPMRLQGIVPLKVTDPDTELQPEIETDGPWPPQSRQTIRVAEARDRPMTYTLAVVDEGLLGLTSFATPALHDRFYQREALGVMTWDLFDQVVGAYDADLQRLLAVGGSDSGKEDSGSRRERRFPPVVRFLGPFRLDAGAQRSHPVDLPQYIGAVRVMAVAGHDGSYGSAERTVPVRDAVSGLITLPRVLGPGETVTVPVRVFAHEEGVAEASVALEPGDGLSLAGASTREVSFEQGAEQMVRFRLRVAERIGETSVTTVVRSSEGGSRTTTNLEIRSASLPEARTVRRRLEPGETWRQPVNLHGLKGTNEVTLEASAVPPFGLGQRLGYLIRYPYGCIEQTTSAAYPQVYLPRLAELPPERIQATEDNVHAALERLRSFQRGDGGFSYWPGGSRYNGWADVYAGNFMVAAERVGYDVPEALLSDWLDHAATVSQEWTAGGDGEAMTQAFRLLVLARADRPQIGAMNRLRAGNTLPAPGRWLLATAYARLGLDKAAGALMGRAPSVSREYDRPGATFGSAMRDRAILLTALHTLGRHEEAAAVARTLAEGLRGGEWHSTQSVGFGLAALGGYVVDQQEAGTGVAFAYGRGDSATRQRQVDKPVVAVPLATDEGAGPVVVRNDGSRPLYLTLTTEGTPPPGAEEARQEGLDVAVTYYGRDGESLDIADLASGTDVRARVEVANRSGQDVEQLALRHVVPSGWEISNERLRGAGDGATGEYVYRDIRDDRVHTHFGLADGESRTFELRFTAAYPGRYYAPGVVLEAMYDDTLKARTAGQWIEVSGGD
ncbi:MG2 domain-containing protein [Aquisalimonas lutea]|uniref:Ig-like domain-containing alpha-2-macroglobulin family protein n=1 Tax=Aquisalimonas lutea TaxID=1327750 RepID=UPI0025B2EF43|nr:Ig-like domain-containing alpha-2-macroglobulin family protein [Aquisalimonas lutea]MDN3517571.1 MG2 domain-containing protein [Aquisalimonas lutea]